MITLFSNKNQLLFRLVYSNKPVSDFSKYFEPWPDKVSSIKLSCPHDDTNCRLWYAVMKFATSV